MPSARLVDTVRPAPSIGSPADHPRAIRAPAAGSHRIRSQDFGDTACQVRH
jgi:hypothetical protein